MPAIVLYPRLHPSCYTKLLSNDVILTKKTQSDPIRDRRREGPLSAGEDDGEEVVEVEERQDDSIKIGVNYHL